jgi:outer membrane protein assembly factor BamB
MLSAMLLLCALALQDIEVGAQIRRLHDTGTTILAVVQDRVHVVELSKSRVVHSVALNTVGEGERVLCAGAGWVVVGSKSAIRGFDPEMKTRKWETRTGHPYTEGFVAGSSAVLSTLEGTGSTRKTSLVELSSGKIRGNFTSAPGGSLRADGERVFVFPRQGEEILAFDHTARKLWAAEAADSTRIAASPRGILYLKSDKSGNVLRAIDPATGKDLLALPLSIAETGVGISAERVYLSKTDPSGGGRIRALSLKDGKEIWSSGLPNPPRQVIEAPGVLCALSATKIWGLNPADGARRWELRARSPFHLRLEEFDEMPLLGGRLLIAEFNERGDPARVFAAAPETGEERPVAGYDEEPFSAILRPDMLLTAVGSKLRVAR